MNLIRKCACLLLLSASGYSLSAQVECVDYDAASYPKTVGGQTYNWNGAAWNFTNMKQKKVTGLGYPQFKNYFFKGMLEYLPAGYSTANTTVKHPLIIFFHGGASAGQGTIADLCRLFKDRGDDMATHLSLPGRVERNTSMFTSTYLGQTYQYIVASPQFTIYKRQYNANGTPFADNIFPSANEVEQVIDYLVNSRYANKIDLRRIYLVGYSTGANMIMEYAGSSVARAKRVAAVMPVSLCSQLFHVSNSAAGISAANIANAKLKTWFVYCTSDNCGTGPQLNVPQDWVTGIRNAGGAPPRFTMLTRAGPVGSHMEGLYNCSDTLAHDAWSRAFDPNFKASFTGNGATTNTNDGVNLNMYDWFTQQISAVLPVTLKSFTASLVNAGVELKWTTTDEKDNASFTIERAGSDQKFAAIGTRPGSADGVGERRYAFTDADPLPGLGFYRLVQTDIDGQKTYLQIRKILNHTSGQEVLIYPNPFSSEISAFVSLEASQKVELTLTDISGKMIRAFSGLYGKGSSEVRIAAGDLPKGIYFLKVEGAAFSITRKLMKQ